MTIDEAIAHERKSAKSNREAEALFLRDDFIWNAKEERKFAEEHEQLAEWLEELKALKHFESNYEHNLNAERNKAIDEFAEKMIIMMPGHKQDVLSIAEKLKAGAE